MLAINSVHCLYSRVQYDSRFSHLTSANNIPCYAQSEVVGLASAHERYIWGPVRDRGAYLPRSNTERLDRSTVTQEVTTLDADEVGTTGTPRLYSAREMSTTETLRMQLDALRTEFHVIKAENRRLREENPERAEVQDLERELQASQEENVRLAQQLSEAGQSDRHSGETNQAGLVQLREETRELQQRVNDMSARLAEAEEALQLAQRRAKQAEEYVQTLESDRE